MLFVLSVLLKGFVAIIAYLWSREVGNDLSLLGQVNLKLILHLLRQDISFTDVFSHSELSFGDENSEHYNWKGLSLSVTGLLMIFRESHDAPEWHLALSGRVCLILGTP